MLNDTIAAMPLNEVKEKFDWKTLQKEAKRRSKLGRVLWKGTLGTYIKSIHGPLPIKND